MTLCRNSWWRRLWVDWLDIEYKFDESASDKGTSKMGGKVVMEEQLATHDVERDVVGGPCKEEKARRVI